MRDNDRYAINEAHPDSLALLLLLGPRPQTSLLVGSMGSFAQFALVPERSSYVTVLRSGTAPSSLVIQDTSALNLDVGLLVYRGASFTTPLLTIAPQATAFNGGRLVVGLP